MENTAKALLIVAGMLITALCSFSIAFVITI